MARNRQKRPATEAELTRAKAEAAEWFEMLRRPAVTTRALKAFHAWRRSEVNLAAFRHIEAEWRAAGALASHPNAPRPLAHREP